MNDKQIYMFRAAELYEVYKKAKGVCDPLDFQVRQKNLLYALCDFLLADYWTNEDQWKKTIMPDSSEES